VRVRRKRAIAGSAAVPDSFGTDHLADELWVGAVDLRGRFSNPEVRAVVVQVAQLADGIKVEED
jgi:hypothetical protein